MPGPLGASDSLKGLLNSDKIEVPEYQRTYDWNKGHVEQLLVCLSEHQQEHPGALQPNPYFLGNLLIHTEIADRQSKYWLVDGQQRLVTLTILAGVIRDLLIENKLYKLAFELQNDIIGDNSAENPKVRARDTERQTSPRELLWPIQTPPDQKVEFQFADDYNTDLHGHLFSLAAPITAQFPLPQGTEFEINIGTKFQMKTSIEAGEIVQDLYGDLTLEAGATVSTVDILKFKSEWRSEVKYKRMRFPWNKAYLIPRHFEKVIPNFIKSEMQVHGADVEKYLNDWKDIVTFMSFTTTTFDDETDAIYYFGKLNDADTSQQLNVGDLMRHHAALVKGGAPLQHAKDDIIVNSWNEVELLLKGEREKDMVPIFLSSWLTAQANRQTARKAYSALKTDSKNQFYKSTGSWDKDKFSGWMNRIQEASIWFRQVVFPEMGDSYHLRMKCIEGLAKQHRALFLCGLLALEKHGLKDEMSRLINIFEFMTIKGVEFPTLIGANGITSQDRYAFVDKYCEQLHTKSIGFLTKMRPSQAKTILDNFADEVKSSCTSIWDGAKADTALPNVTGWDVNSLCDSDINQSLAKLILSRIEIEKGGTKTWAEDVEVEHILPQTWKDEWADNTKGGGFTDSDQSNKSLNKLGNKTLLNPGSNKTLSNSNFKAKQSHPIAGYDIQARDWTVTKDIVSTKVNVWNPTEIEKRSKKLFGQLIRIYDGNFMK